MGEKRFTVESTMVRECILDNASGEQLDTFDYAERLCELLNEQQATISALKEENEQLKQEIIVYKKAFQEQVQRCSL